MPSPLLGYNTNVRHRGKLYHIQTEDSGVKHPHIITHLFADGGRVIASKKSTYAEHVGAEDYQVVVKKMMKAQHKDMFIALRDGVYDDDEPADLDIEVTIEGAETSERPSLDVDALERAAARLAASDTGSIPSPPQPPPAPRGQYQSTQPARVDVIEEKRSESIFGGDLLSEKSLDEVILSYLAEDLEEPDD